MKTSNNNPTKIDPGARYKEWVDNPYFDEETTQELLSIKENQKEIEDRFYKDLDFGTAGLRGKIGAGTNRMNRYIVARASQGLAEVISELGPEAKQKGVAIAYDNRHFSAEFAETAALTLNANGIRTFLYPTLSSTPQLSYAVRKLKTQSGIVITASHNPKAYNGYKVYWEEGSQIRSKIANKITENILKISDYSKIPRIKKADALSRQLFHYIPDTLNDQYIDDLKGIALRNEEIDKSLRIVYTPLNGTGNIPVRRILRERGFDHVKVVDAQEKPDPNFKTVEYPNPEDPRAFQMAESVGREFHAELLIATDPDCDRLAVEVAKGDQYIVLNGNQTGAILTEYVLSTLSEKGKLPKNPAIVKTIVTGELSRKIADHYRVTTFDTLTGFKNICSFPNLWDQNGQHNFILGFEESIGFLVGDLVRDKDAVNAAMFLAEAAAYYKTKGLSLLDKLEEIYRRFGYYKEELISFVLEGKAGQERILRMMEQYSARFPRQIGDARLSAFINYNTLTRLDLDSGEEFVIDIEKTNALKFIFDDECWYALRPSGTEPKIKLYLYSKGKDHRESESRLTGLKKAVLEQLESIE